MFLDAAQQVLENPTPASDASSDIASTISQAIQGLSAGAEGLQEPVLEEELMKMFNGSGSENNFLPFMQGIINELVSFLLMYLFIVIICLKVYTDVIIWNIKNSKFNKCISLGCYSLRP